MAKEHQISHEGELTLGENAEPISCYILTNGDRILSTAGTQRALGLETGENQRSSGRMDEILKSKAITRSLTDGKTSANFQTLTCYRGKQKISAFRAESLPEICEVLLKARDFALKNNLELGSRQKSVIEHADILIRSFAKVGIIALVDEATGYQFEREKDALQDIHKKFIAEELQKYEPQFSNEFYREIFRLNGWPYTVRQIKYGERPSVIGTWTKKYVYGALPNGILEILLGKTPRDEKGRLTNKLFQNLNPKDGIEALQDQLKACVLLMNISDDWKDFERLWNKKFGQLEIPFSDYKLLDPKPKEPLSRFNKTLKTALGFNSKEDGHK